MRIVRSGPVRAFRGIVFCLLFLFAAGWGSGAAPDAAKTAPPPEPVVIGVLGDSLGDGLWAGLYRILRRSQDYRVIKKSQVSTGLALSHSFDWVKTAKALTKDGDFQIAVIFLGANDQQALKHGKKWHRFRSKEWTRIYSMRITQMIRALKKSGLKVYWVGLPVMQKAGFDEGARFLNGLYRKMAAKERVAYIDIRAITSDEEGAYATHYKDAQGKMRLMRADDGVHFTMSGYAGIAAHVLARIEKDRRKKARGAKPVAKRQGTENRTALRP